MKGAVALISAVCVLSVSSLRIRSETTKSSTDPALSEGSMKSMVFLGLYYEKYPARATERTMKVRQNVMDLMKACAENPGFPFGQSRGCKVMIGMPAKLQEHPAMQTFVDYNKTTNNLFFVADADLSKEVNLAKTQKIAKLRNNMMEQAMTKFGDHKYFTVFDGDGIVKFDKETIQTVEEALKVHAESKWEALTFDDDNYYDYFALRCSVNTPNCYHFRYNCKRGGLEEVDGKPRWDCLRELHRKKDETALKEVSSAFNGMAIYKTGAIKGCQYDGTDIDNGMDCEHVAFHRCMVKNGGRVVISGLKITTYRGGRAELFTELPDGYQEIPGYGIINTKTGIAQEDEQ